MKKAKKIQALEIEVGVLRESVNNLEDTTNENSKQFARVINKIIDCVGITASVNAVVRDISNEEAKKLFKDKNVFELVVVKTKK